MLVTINPKKITPDLRRKIEDYMGLDISQYPLLQVDVSRVGFSLMIPLTEAAEIPNSGVVPVETNLVKPLAAVKVKPKELILDEGGKRLRYHVEHAGLIGSDYNVKTIQDWFARHPHAKFDARTVDVVVFRELYDLLQWSPNHALHKFFAKKLNPPPSKPEPPAPQPESPKPPETEKERRERIWQEYLDKSEVNI